MSSIWAWGFAAAIGVPLLAHLLSQRGGRLAVFPTVRFVQKAAADTAKWLRPRHWLLLLLRIAVLSLIVAAFMRPIWQREAPAAEQGEGIIAAIIIDRSATMARTHRGVSLFEQAKHRAIDTLKQLDPETDKAVLVWLDAVPNTPLPNATSGFEATLIPLIEAAEPTLERGDMAGAVRLAFNEAVAAAELAADEGGAIPPIHLEVFSDMQAGQLDELVRGMPRLGSAQLRLHAFGPPKSSNLAIAQARLKPSEPIIGQPAVATADIANLSDQSAEAKVTFTFDGVTREDRIRIAPRSTVPVTFPILPTTPGAKHASFKIVSDLDNFDIDNETGLAFTAAPARRIALVTDQDTTDPSTSAFYIARALRPENIDEDTEADPSARVSGVALATWRSSQLAAGLDGGGRPSPQFVVLVGINEMDASAMTALHRFINEGGAVLWITDGRPAAQHLRVFSKIIGDSAFLPIMPDATEPWRTNANLKIADGDFADEVLSVFQGPSRNAVINATFKNVLAGRAPPASDVLLAFEDGTPALAAGWIGTGRMAVLAADLSPTESDLVKGPVLVPLLHQLARHSSPGKPLPDNPHPGHGGRAVLHDVNVNAAVKVVTPSGQVVRHRANQSERGAVIIDWPNVEEVGVYRIETSSGGETLGHVVSQIDATESDLDAADAQLLAAMQREANTNIAQAKGADDLLKPRPTELWPWLIAAAILLVILEPLILALLGGGSITGGSRKGNDELIPGKAAKV